MNRISVFVLALSVLVVTACEKKPEAQFQAAQQAIESAGAAEAGVYAPAEFEAARTTFLTAEATIAEQEAMSAWRRNYRGSIDLLNQAKTEAETAQTTAATRKEGGPQQAETALMDAQLAIQTASEAVEKARTGRMNRQELEAVQMEIAAAQTALSEAQQSLETGSYQEALKQLQDVKGRADMAGARLQQPTTRRPT